MLITLAEKLLEVDAALIRTAVAEELRRGEEVLTETVGGEPCVFLKGLHGAEKVIAERLIQRAAGNPPWPEIDLDKALPWVEQKTGKTLSASQREAVRLVLASKVTVITGGPGVGKTSTLDSILRILIAKGVQVALAAPTGRAAKRMTEQTGLEAKTIHRLLEIDPKHGGFSRTEDNPLDLRSARGGRDLDGGCATHERAHARPSRPMRACCSWVTWTNCPRSGQDRFWPTSSHPSACPWRA